MKPQHAQPEGQEVAVAGPFYVRIIAAVHVSCKNPHGGLRVQVSCRGSGGFQVSGDRWIGPAAEVSEGGFIYIYIHIYIYIYIYIYTCIYEHI